jgi:hypothetical protein
MLGPSAVVVLIFMLTLTLEHSPSGRWTQEQIKRLKDFSSRLRVQHLGGECNTVGVHLRLFCFGSVSCL